MTRTVLTLQEVEDLISDSLKDTFLHQHTPSLPADDMPLLPASLAVADEFALVTNPPAELLTTSFVERNAPFVATSPATSNTADEDMHTLRRLIPVDQAFCNLGAGWNDAIGPSADTRPQLQSDLALGRTHSASHAASVDLVDSLALEPCPARKAAKTMLMQGRPLQSRPRQVLPMHDLPMQPPPMPTMPPQGFSVQGLPAQRFPTYSLPMHAFPTQGLPMHGLGSAHAQQHASEELEVSCMYKKRMYMATGRGRRTVKQLEAQQGDVTEKVKSARRQQVARNKKAQTLNGLLDSLPRMLAIIISISQSPDGVVTQQHRRDLHHALDLIPTGDKKLEELYAVCSLLEAHQNSPST